MFTEEIDDAESTTPADVRAEFEETLGHVVESVGVEETASRTGVDADRLEALLAGESPDVTVAEAAEILALSEDYPAADALLAELQDDLMLKMSTAVKDVDAVAADVDLDLDAKEVQQKVEGRQDMTLAEYAAIRRYLAAENPW